MSEEHAKKLKSLRGNRTRDQVAEESGLSYEGIKYIEKHGNPSLNSLNRLFVVYKPTIEDVLELHDLGFLMENDAAYNRSESHKKHLQVFEGQTYHCCFVSNSGSGDLESLVVGPFSYCSDGYTQAKAEISGYTYDCKGIVTNSAMYTIMSFASSDNLDDRAFLLLPYDSGVKNLFDVGLGAMLSLAKKDSHRQIPSFQLVAIISERYVKKLGGIDKFKEVIDLKLVKAWNDGYTVQVEGIHDLSFRLYKKIEEIVKERDPS